ncbi:hypothetical protein CISG_05828 [Coccidioides immitis RMSCC 3703]|uniref:Uncharacterized protein n=2 Tax=Coccidioides immitis TaxID=5501 RepID=A0A0J8QXD0_COCIT|nr:hypothetical protein CIRG_10239 [Coccidioides immitis RMSCC 2394]KMU76685.1 hypothetical protein CISG_05828 [Coccidioides immitis RMSCC 3703]
MTAVGKPHTLLISSPDDVELPYIKAFLAVLAEDIKVFLEAAIPFHWEACGRPAPEAELGVIYQVITRGLLICFQSEIVHLLQQEADQKKSRLEEVDSGAAHSGPISEEGTDYKLRKRQPFEEPGGAAH